MRVYQPDTWQILKFVTDKEGVIYKVLGGWYGGFAKSDHWKLNSGIEQWSLNPLSNLLEFTGYSGSVYFCDPMDERHSMLTLGVVNSFKKDLEEGVTSGFTVEEISFERFKEEFVNGKH